MSMHGNPQGGRAYRYWLADARQRSGMTQGEVAAACGISRSAYQKYEYGQRAPSCLVSRNLASVLHFSEDRFQKAEDRQSFLEKVHEKEV